MTWDEFVAYVNKELERQGAHGRFDLSIIEFDCAGGDVNVDTTDEFFSLIISN